MKTLTQVPRPQAPSKLSNALVFGWRAVLKFKHVPEQLFDLVMTPIMFTLLFTYIFVVMAHFRFPYADPKLRGGAGTKFVAGGAALAMLAVLVAMCFMKDTRNYMVASSASLGVIVLALLAKNATRKPLPA